MSLGLDQQIPSIYINDEAGSFWSVSSSESAADNETMIDDQSEGLNISFAGCGFLGIYHVGVSACFRKYAPELLVQRIAGASAGALAAACLLCNADLGKEGLVVHSAKQFDSLMLIKFSFHKFS